MLEGNHFRYIKIGMYGLNCLVALLGLALGGVGVWIRVDFDQEIYKKILDPIFSLCSAEDEKFDFSFKVHMDTIANFLIFLGCAIIVIGCVGLFGTVRERQAILGMFCVLLFTIFAILLTAGIQSMVKKDTFLECEKALTKNLNSAVIQYYINTSEAEFMDQVQTHVGCCGAINGATDYGQMGPPESCGDKKNYTKSCDKAIKGFFNAIADNMIMILVVSFCIGLFTLVGIGMSAYLFISVRKAKRIL